MTGTSPSPPPTPPHNRPLSDPEVIMLRPDMRKPASSTLTPVPQLQHSLKVISLRHRYVPQILEHTRYVYQFWQKLEQSPSWLTPDLLQLYRKLFLLSGLSRACEIPALTQTTRELLRLLNTFLHTSPTQAKPDLALLRQYMEYIDKLGQETQSFYVPKPQLLAVQIPQPQEKPQSQEKGTVLVIEEDPEQLLALQSLFASHGLPCLPVRQASEALALVRQIPPTLPDIMVFSLPTSPLQELSAHHAIRNIPGIPLIPTIFLVHPQDYELMRQVYRIGLDELLQKPPHLSLVIAHTQDILRRQHQQRLLQQGEFSPGIVLHQRYEVLGEIARGGMGIVYLVQHLETMKVFALKILSVHQSRNNRNLQRFQRETRILHQLQHPSLIRIQDSGLFQNIPYYVMAYLLGGSLVDHLKSGALPFRVALPLMMSIAEALHYAHEQGIWHRDLKSSNILFDETGNPILTDFGSALPVDDDLPRITNSGNLIGTPCYMAPEQFTASHLIDHRSDIFSLGFVLYEMLAGYHPLAELHPAAAMAKIVIHQYPKLSEIVPSLPPEVIAICERALAPNREDRFPTALAFAQACRDVLR